MGAHIQTIRYSCKPSLPLCLEIPGETHSRPNQPKKPSGQELTPRAPEVLETRTELFLSIPHFDNLLPVRG